ncbi:hypothetical protein [Nocardia africana]|uniref:Catalase n=1 Tax=Nocardia africana TaxID=134964 RepID=A0ABW6NS09_9NOCA
MADRFIQHDMLRTTKMKFDGRKYQDSRFATRHDSGADHDFMSQLSPSKPNITSGHIGHTDLSRRVPAHPERANAAPVPENERGIRFLYSGVSQPDRISPGEP